ncbi:MAG: NUDIX hydrolase [Balneolaceae bacterium]|nr:MAG: NUDIX hydrolase [Balneolaceae bacterium]
MSNSFQFTKSRWDVLQDKKVFETPVFSLHQIDLIPENRDKTVPFYVLKAPEWINVIALTADEQIVLVEQYRAGIDAPSVEIPGGMTDPGEDPLTAAKRELLEETGYSSGHWTKIGITSSNPAILSNYTHLYLAESCEQTAEQMTDGNEDIAVHLLPFSHFLDLIRDGTVHHAIVLAAVSHYLLYRERESF